MGEEINKEIGKKIRSFRKTRGLTVQALAQKIFRSKATLSKYESGGISIDLLTLYKIAEALSVHVEQLLYIPPKQVSMLAKERPLAFFSNSNRFYSYFFDGRNNRVVSCIIDMIPQEEAARFKTILYMNVRDMNRYQECENTYWGYTEHFDALTSMVLKNQATPIENITINILASFLESDRKWGLMSGVSFRPFMPIALKMLFSKIPITVTSELIQELKISREDIRVMKMYNMFSVT